MRQRLGRERWRWLAPPARSEEHTSELQSHSDLVCRLLLEKKKKQKYKPPSAESNTDTGQISYKRQANKNKQRTECREQYWRMKTVQGLLCGDEYRRHLKH